MAVDGKYNPCDQVCRNVLKQSPRPAQSPAASAQAWVELGEEVWGVERGWGRKGGRREGWGVPQQGNSE